MRERLRHIPEAALRRLECSLRRQGVSGRIIIRPYLLLRLESPGGLSSDFAHVLGQCLFDGMGYFRV